MQYAMTKETEAETREQLEASLDFFAGMKRYYEANPAVPEFAADKVWNEGTTTLYHFKAAQSNKAPLLLVPSLINRAHIFDLTENRSMIRYFNEMGHDCFLLDWDAPGEQELQFTLEDYIQRLNRAIEFTATNYQAPILTGYCMGGILSVAAAQCMQKHLKGLVLLATPWKFNALEMLAEKQVELALQNNEPLTPQFIYAFFYAASPSAIHEHFKRFSQMKADSEEADAFIAIQHWLQDGVPLAHKVAKESFQAWPKNGGPYRSAITVAGEVIDPAQITLPSFVITADEDNIVPTLSSLPLQLAIENSTKHVIEGGHISLVAGRSAVEHCFTPLANWIATL